MEIGTRQSTHFEMILFRNRIVLIELESFCFVFLK